MMPDDAVLTWTVDANSRFEAMTKYYEHMDWGTYTTPFPDLDTQTYAEWGFESEWRRTPALALVRKAWARTDQRICTAPNRGGCVGRVEANDA